MEDNPKNTRDDAIIVRDHPNGAVHVSFPDNSEPAPSGSRDGQDQGENS